MKLKKSVLVLAALAVCFACLCACAADESTTTTAAPAEPTTVMALTKDTFDGFIEGQEFTVVEFFAPWCGHCKRLAPEYEAAAKVLKEEGIQLASVDATAETDLAGRFEIQGYPTLKAFRKGKPEEYKGGRTKDAIIQWVRRMTGDSVEDVASMAEAEKLAATEPVVFVGRFKSKDSEEYKAFHSVADESRQLGKFIAVLDPALDAAALNTVVSIREQEGTTDPVKVTDTEGLKKFLDLERFPLFGEINAGNYGEYFQSTRDVIWFAGAEDDFKSAGKIIREAAKAIRDKASYVWLNTKEFKDHAEMALGVQKFPALVVQRSEGRYIFKDAVFDNVMKIIDFVKDVYADKIEKHLISEDIPETNDEPVKVVVGKSFNDMVLQDDKDVFLEVYAPWCGHCKQFEPIYTEFAEAMKEHPHVVVAKMDGTKNESPNSNFQFSGFPTIFFVKAGSSTPLTYDGPRTADGLRKYLNEHGSKPVGEAAPPAAEGPKDEL